MTITFIGHGYVGLVTACVFADFGNKVWVIGHTAKKIEQLKKGDPLIFEPGLKELLEKNLRAKRIFFTTEYDKAIPESDIIFIAVGTPPSKSKDADLSAVHDVAEKIAKHLKEGFAVISCKSTVPVGTNKKIEEIINKKKHKHAQVAVASCPEFLREGSAIADTVNPDRVVIGSENKKAIDLLLELHRPINGKRVITNLESAELVKYASNALLATKISFANLISFFCEKTGADVETVLEAVGLDHRLGRLFLYPGIGYGGSCLPKDVSALTHVGQGLGIDVTLLKGVEEINERAKQNFVDLILRILPPETVSKKIAVWGLSFKPSTDDIRFAPSIFILEKLLSQNYRISVYDPAAMEKVEEIFKNKLSYGSSPYDVLKDASALCILTEWNEFKQIDLKKVSSLMKEPIVFDGRNIYTPSKMRTLGFRYFALGRS